MSSDGGMDGMAWLDGPSERKPVPPKPEKRKTAPPKPKKRKTPARKAKKPKPKAAAPSPSKASVPKRSAPAKTEPPVYKPPVVKPAASREPEPVPPPEPKRVAPARPGTLRVDGRDAECEAGETLLDVARRVGVTIPTLCHRDELPSHTSCMVCLVRDIRANRFIPACTALAEDGMDIDASSDEVRAMRRQAVELLLGEHAGDCEGPCTRICPAHMNIPLMIRQIAAGANQQALITVKQHIPLPAVLGRICPAPCEKGCRRGDRDEAVAICLLKRFVADEDLAREKTWVPTCAENTDKRVVVVGAGPTGLSAAYYLRIAGHACTVLDAEDSAGGALLYNVPDDRLPPDVLDGEIAVLREMGVEFVLGKRLGGDTSLDELREQYDAVVLAIGTVEEADAAALGLTYGKTGIAIDGATFTTNISGVFAGGNATRPGRLAVRAVAHGQSLARSVDAFLKTGTAAPSTVPFDCRLRHLEDSELTELMHDTDPSARRMPVEPSKGFTYEEAVAEAGRCMHCDCRKPHTCRLRQLAGELGLTTFHGGAIERKQVRRVTQHARLVYEPGKCIDCGICVRTTQKMAEPLGLAFIGRGFEVRVDVPFGDGFDQALTKAADVCVDACPTGALAWKEG